MLQVEEGYMFGAQAEHAITTILSFMYISGFMSGTGQ